VSTIAPAAKIAAIARIARAWSRRTITLLSVRNSKGPARHDAVNQREQLNGPERSDGYDEFNEFVAVTELFSSLLTRISRGEVVVER
jgi:hypothetical protein